jgi:hypothetical protein
MSILCPVAMSLLCFTCIPAAQATQGSRERAQEMVRQAQAQQEQLLARAPRLGEIDAAIRDDCAAKNLPVTRDSFYCRCAAAVTMKLWRSGVDPQMLPRLLDFANSRGDATAQSFVAYQGPELYRPLCSLAAS